MLSKCTSFVYFQCFVLILVLKMAGLLDSVLTITCKNGYRLVGEGKLTCGLDDSWNHPTPRCRKGNYNNIPFKFPHTLHRILCSQVKFKRNYRSGTVIRTRLIRSSILFEVSVKCFAIIFLSFNV